MKNIINNKYFLFGVALVIGLAIGLLINGNEETANEHQSHESSATATEVWTCSMHPQIKRQEPGDCPICGMELIPLTQEGTDPMMAQAVRMTPTAMQLASVVTAVVGKENEAKTIRLNGKVQENEQQLYKQTAHFAGRIEQLMVDYEGEYVKKGQVLAKLYAPQLLTAQQELLEAQQFEDTQPALFKAAKQKLKNWKLTDAQINKILENNEVQNSFPLLADETGYVTQLNVKKGDYVEKGAVLYALADLSKVWVMLDVYEADLAAVQKGDQVTVKAKAFPSREWKGEIDFIDPVINPATRVASARVVLDNKELLLKPELLVTAQLQANVKKAEAISVPKSAVLWTGKRSVVYVQEKNESGIYFSMREVTLGQSLGDSFVILDGLTTGEEIVVNGAFSIDAAAQLAGKPSMMNRQESSLPLEINEQAKQALQQLMAHYLKMKNALVKDDFADAKKANAQLLDALARVPMNAFSEDAHQLWMPVQQKLKQTASAFQQTNTLADGRQQFISLSLQMISMVKSFEIVEKSLYVQHCPMADSNKGADWLSAETAIRNPYFGEDMLSCGEVIEEIK